MIDEHYKNFKVRDYMNEESLSSYLATNILVIGIILFNGDTRKVVEGYYDFFAVITSSIKSGVYHYNKKYLKEMKFNVSNVCR